MSPRIRRLAVVLWFCGLLVLPSRAQSTFSSAVAADHEEASRVGAEVLAKGGNAIDAAVATAFAEGVVRPDSSGLGGGGFLVYYRAADGLAMTLDFRETAPAAASRDMFLKDGRVVPGLSEDGGLAAAVPGEVAGLALAHRKYGRLSWPLVLRGATDLARCGVAVTPAVHGSLWGEFDTLVRYPLAAHLFLGGGSSVPPVGTILKNPALAETLKILAQDGPKAFYHGPLAQDIARACQRQGGVMTLADLARYEPVERQPLWTLLPPNVVCGRTGLSMLSMPPPSSGGIALVEILNILGALSDWPPSDPTTYHHLLAEAMKHGFADRASFLGDPAFVRVPVRRLASKSYARFLARTIDPLKTKELETYGRRTVPDDHGTTHVSVIDAEGNAVAMTLTVNTGFGSKVVVPGRGFVLNNEMDDFSSAPGVPNTYGLVQSEANAIAPGKRPLSCMTPTIVLDGQRVVMVVGASGGPRIISGTLQVLLNALGRRMGADQSVREPRIHHQWRPDLVRVEPALSSELQKGLVKRGHQIRIGGGGCCVQALVVTGSGIDAASDPRKGGRPAGLPFRFTPDRKSKP